MNHAYVLSFVEGQVMTLVLSFIEDQIMIKEHELCLLCSYESCLYVLHFVEGQICNDFRTWIMLSTYYIAMNHAYEVSFIDGQIMILKHELC